MRRSLRTTTMAALCMLAACSRDTVTDPGASSRSGEATIVDLVAIPRFSIEMTASGTFKPGAPITVTGSVSSNVSTSDVEILVILPELEGSRMTDGSGRLAVNVSLPAAVRQRVPLAQGQRRAFSATVVIPEAGYYRIAVSARKRSFEPVRARGSWIQDVVYQERWVIIDENGGRVVNAFDPTAFPVGVFPVPGPRRLWSRPVPADAPPVGEVLADPTPGCDVWRVVYMNIDANGGEGALEILEGVQYTYDVTDDQTGNVINGGGGTIGPDGEILVCTGPQTGYNGKVLLTGSAGAVQPNVAATFAGGNTQESNAYLDLPVQGTYARAFVNLQATAPRSEALLGYDIAPLVVNVSTTADHSSYSASTDQVTVQYSYVWGEFGIFNLAHEYGHAAHQRVLGGNVVSGSCEATHDPYRPSNLQCAFSEGFADFHGVYTRRDVLFNSDVSDWQIELNWYYVSGTDGSVRETSVAAFLYDLVDGPDDPDSFTNGSDGDDTGDTVQFPGHYIADIIRTCRVTYQVAFQRRANGVDDLIYCLERTVDPSVTGSSVYFPTRSSNEEAVGETEAAAEPTGWSQAAIRALWLKNLYGQ